MARSPPASRLPVPQPDGDRGISPGVYVKLVRMNEANSKLFCAKAFLGREVHLFLTVKVRPGWLEERERYGEMGLDFRDGDG